MNIDSNLDRRSFEEPLGDRFFRLEIDLGGFWKPLGEVFGGFWRRLGKVFRHILVSFSDIDFTIDFYTLLK